MSAAAAGFLGSFVECVEALSVVLAVGVVRGWRGALAGVALGLLGLAAVILAGGPALAAAPLRWVQLGMGAILLALGAKWLRKAVLRAAGRVPLRDENRAFARAQASLRSAAPAHSPWQRIAIMTTAQVTFAEGIEVAVLVLSLASSGHALLLPAGLGALAALATVSGLAVALHRPLGMIPENQLKAAAAVLMSSFGLFSLGEAAGAVWPAGSWAIAGLAASIGGAALLAVQVLRRSAR